MEQPNVSWRPTPTSPITATIFTDISNPSFLLASTSTSGSDPVVQRSAIFAWSYMVKPCLTHFRVPNRTPVSKEVYIADLHGSSLSLLRPLKVMVNESETGWCAFADDIDELVLGSNEEEVITDMMNAVADVYNLLKSEADNLGPLQARHWSFLQSVIIESA